MKNSKVTSFQKYKRKPHLNIGIIVFGCVFLYMAVTIFLFLTNKHIAVYEVRNGSILVDTSYTGIVLRDEKVISSAGDGYINFISDNEDKIGSKTNVYTLSAKEIKWTQNDQKNTDELSAGEMDSILMKIQSFTDNYKDAQFKEIYSLRNSINTILNKKTIQNRKNQLDRLLDNKENITVYQGTEDGIIVHSIDGYEDLTESKLNADLFSKNKYSANKIKDNELVSKGTPIYKIITSDKWKVAILLDDNMARKLKNSKVVKVKFQKDNETEKANIEIIKKGKNNIALLTFYKSMIRYASDRFLDIELVLEDSSGLKIPKSAIVQKDFYVVPESFLTQGGNSKENGVLLDTGNGSAEFFRVDVYYRDEETGDIYLNPDVFKTSKTLIKPDSSERLTLSEKKALDGVYCINKGYAVFKQTIDPVAVSDEYYIIKNGMDYGLSNYDHIVLDGSTVKENDVIF